MSAHLALPAGATALMLRTLAHPVELRTQRTLLRMWRDEDLPGWASMNADPTVRRHFPTLLSHEEASAEADRCRQTLQRRGWGLWALELPGRQAFAGMVGLNVPGFEAPFTPAVEIGWRLSPEAWGRGYATEAATAALAFAFQVLELNEVVSFTVNANEASRRVMQRLGMTHDAAGDFDHPRIAAGHPLCRHVLYRLPASRFAQTGVTPDTDGNRPPAPAPHNAGVR